MSKRMADDELMSRQELIAALGDADAALAIPAGWDEAGSDDDSVLKWVVSHDSHSCLAVNGAALACFGHTRAEFLALPFKDFFPPGVHAVDAAIAGGMPAKNMREYRDQGGQVLLLQLCHVDLNYAGRSARLIIASDVTRQSRAEANLERIKEWMQRSQEYARFGIWDWDIRSGVTLLSEQIASLFGHEGGALETTREHFLNAVHPDDRQRVVDAIHAGATCNGDCDSCDDGFDIEYRIVRADGTIRWIHERGGVEHCADGKPTRILGVLQDITEQKQSEQALRESEQHFRLFAENIREMIWVASPDFKKVLYVSHACADILGVRKEELELAHWEKIIYPEDLPLVRIALQKQAQGEPAEVETRIIRPDGRIRWIRVRSFPVHNATGERMASGIAEDVTGRKELEEERIGQMLVQRSNLVREVHHRIKNNLQGVAGLLRQHGNEHPVIGSIIDQAIAQVQTVAVVHGLQGKMADNEVVLCEMVPTIAHMVETLLGSRPVIDVQVDVPQRIRVNEQEAVPIALILNELIMNAAKHAEAASGEVHILISVTWNAQQHHGRIGIVNPGMLPPGFDFVSGKRTGTGLELVRSLLPPQGGKLGFSSQNGQVEAVLELSAPCIYNL